MENMLKLMKQLSEGIAMQFGHNCEVVIHDLSGDLEGSIVHIVNGHVTSRTIGGTSKIVLETIHKEPSLIEDKLGYLTRTPDGRVLKSSTLYIRDENQKIRYIFSVNYDITDLTAIDHVLKDLITVKATQETNQAEQIVSNVNDLLDNLITQAVAMVGKPVAMMNKDDKAKAIQFLNDAGAFLITRSGNKVSKYFGISKFTLYSYINELKELVE